MRRLKIGLICYLLLYFGGMVWRNSQELEPWSAVVTALVWPIYQVTWSASPHVAETVFTPVWVYRDPHQVCVERVVVHRAADGRWN